MANIELDHKTVAKAVQDGGSMRAAALILRVSPPRLSLWLAKNGYAVQKKAQLVEVTFEITEHGREAVAAMVEGEAGQEQEKE
jgi:hypothetical protein